MCFSRSENCNKRELGNAACYRGVNAARFSLRELDTEADRDEERRARLRPSSLWPGARPDPTQGDGEERGRGGGGTRVGQTFPWQDPRDTAEARVQPVKERLRARQSISGAHLHNKWSSHSFCSARSLACTPFVSASTLGSSAHANAGSERRGGRVGGGGGGAAICWSGTLQTLTPCLYQKRQNECVVRWQDL